jgi:hypothetical protein
MAGQTISFAALGDRIRHAHAYQGGPDPYSGDLKVVDLNTNTVYNLDGSRFNQSPATGGTPIPGSTQDRINQRLAGQQDQAQGSDSLPPGNARWLILDRNDREVYSFINTTAQSDANQYARQWLSANARDGQGPFTVVPVSR